VSDGVGHARFALEFRRLDPSLEDALIDHFQRLEEAGDTREFHPHPFTPEEARNKTRYAGADLYFVAVAGGRVLAYGMLRGWDEGYDVPSLGIAVDPGARGSGLARAFMYFLHAAARTRGASAVRLKVYPTNTRAVRLYESLGYRFGGSDSSQLVGRLDLCAPPGRTTPDARGSSL